VDHLQNVLGEEVPVGLLHVDRLPAGRPEAFAQLPEVLHVAAAAQDLNGPTRQILDAVEILTPFPTHHDLVHLQHTARGERHTLLTLRREGEKRCRDVASPIEKRGDELVEAHGDVADLDPALLAPHAPVQELLVATQGLCLKPHRTSRVQEEVRPAERDQRTYHPSFAHAVEVAGPALADVRG
jgi:hypothetical protein